LLVSHWQVDSRATVDLMRGVFGRLAGSLSGNRAEALRQAQMVLLNTPQRDHPFFWGAFTLVGEGHPRARSANMSPIPPSGPLGQNRSKQLAGAF